MSNTRTAAAGTPLRQERYMSSVEFEQGLKAYPVARRCELLKDRTERELIWWLQHRSNTEGGLEALAAELLAEHPNGPATPTMRRVGLKPSQRYHAAEIAAVRDEVRQGRRELGEENNTVVRRLLFPLRGEFAFGCPASAEPSWRELETAASHPESYTAAELLTYCTKAAEAALPDYLRRLCLDPSTRLTDQAPWYFSGLRSTLVAKMAAEAHALRSRIVVTEIGRRVHRCLNMALRTRSLVLVNGEARIGKSFAARTWCEQNAGKARFVEVPPHNDDVGFFRALARGLGLGNFMKYKAAEIRERVEAVLMTGHLVLVLDEAHRLWPQKNYRYGYPSRVNWLMSMVNHGVPICALTTPQFFKHQQRLEQLSSWASEQLTGRITHHEQLPPELSRADLEAVTRSVMPEADAEAVAAIVAYARTSAKYLASIDSIARTAQFIAEESGRSTVCRADIQQAIGEGVIPSDRTLAKSLAVTAPRRRGLPLEDSALLSGNEGEAQPRCIAPAVAVRNGGSTEILTGRGSRAVRPAVPNLAGA